MTDKPCTCSQQFRSKKGVAHPFFKETFDPKCKVHGVGTAAFLTKDFDK